MFLIYLFNIDSFFNVTIIFFKIILKFSAHCVVHFNNYYSQNFPGILQNSFYIESLFPRYLICILELLQCSVYIIEQPMLHTRNVM